MKFDVFHSIGRIDSLPIKLTDREVFGQFFSQVQAAEDLGYGLMWVAESHFSSEVQKQNPGAVIPHYAGEVGLNADSMQLAQAVFARTRKIGFGTAILNIVGGNGGPIAAADRVRTLAWLNGLSHNPRELKIGVAAGRFPYINQPFGIVPRDPIETALWPQYQQLIFIEALEIFLRLAGGETLASVDVTSHQIDRAKFRDDASWMRACQALKSLGVDLEDLGSLPYQKRWVFERLKLVPMQDRLEDSTRLGFVLGSHDPLARDHGLKFADLDVFNLSFTPPAAINQVHAVMGAKAKEAGRIWHRSRMPRTVLVFIDKNPKEAEERASRCFDTYIEAMRGTVATPDKNFLMERALIGDSQMIREQLSPGHSKGFHPDDRLMLWFEFNQADGHAVEHQMRLFAEEVLPRFVG
jgi:alkanesulfonate monooxygenase SsuD/methylene tetrahydromethanopterin reductase-like flavin-dependent oxidoreductase (luciferase family)